MPFARVLSWPFAICAVISGFGSMANLAQACTTTASSTSSLGGYSPAAVKAGLLPAVSNQAGLSCPTAVLVVLSNNYIKATFSSQNNFLLKSGTSTDTVAYTASADPSASVPFTQGSTVDYTQNNLLNVLGLLGGSNANLPFYVKPSATTGLVSVGTYSDTISITWNWYLCTGIGALGACVGTLDKSTTAVTTKIVVNLYLSAKPPTVMTASAVTWDPINKTVNPKSLPGSKRRLSALISNTDIVALDNNTVVVNLPTPTGLMIALDGDGTTSSSIIQVTQGSTASNLTLSYVSASSTTDDVDFSSDNGVTWTYVPDATSATSEAAVTNVRLRFKGSMAASSSVTVTVPYAVK